MFSIDLKHRRPEGAIWLLYLLDYNMSIAVAVGLIALLGVAAEMGVFVFLYLDLSYGQMRERGLMKTKEHLHEAIVKGTVLRLRPMFMTVAVDFVGLVARHVGDRRGR